MPLSAASSFLLGWRVFSKGVLRDWSTLQFRSHNQSVRILSASGFSNVQRNETQCYKFWFTVRKSSFILYQSLAEAYIVRVYARDCVWSRFRIQSRGEFRLRQTCWPNLLKRRGILPYLGMIVPYVGEKPRARLQEELGTLAQFMTYSHSRQ